MTNTNNTQQTPLERFRLRERQVKCTVFLGYKDRVRTSFTSDEIDLLKMNGFDVKGIAIKEEQEDI